jgi:hypothetical protein
MLPPSEPATHQGSRTAHRMDGVSTGNSSLVVSTVRPIGGVTYVLTHQHVSTYLLSSHQVLYLLTYLPK